MKRIPIELKSKAMTSHIPLAVFGYVLGRAGVLSPLDEVALPIKTLDHSPVEKLIEALVLILAGGRATSQADLLLRPNRWLASGWGQDQFAQQATLADTLDAFDQSSIASLRTAFEMILQTHSAALSHDYRCGDLWLDGDLTGLPASRRAEGSTKSYFAGKKNRVGRQLARLCVRPYGETLGSLLYSGAQHSIKCLQPLVLLAERLMHPKTHQFHHLIWRLDASFGSDDAIKWLVARDYQLLVKGYNSRRAMKVASQVAPHHWQPLRPDKWITEVPMQVRYGRRVQTLALKWYTPSEGARYALLWWHH